MPNPKNSLKHIPIMVSKKIKTLFSNPLAVYRKYKGKLKSEIVRLRGGIPPIYGEDYDRHWNFTSFENKVILDLGADYGSTAYYFLRKGASKVIAVDGDPQLASMLKFNSQKFKKIVPIQIFIDSSEKIEKLISDYHPDLVKVDIEGYEKLLTNIDVTKVNEWLIEAHSKELYLTLVKFYLKHDFSIRSFPYINNLMVIHAHAWGERK
jgi:precorrin-6B methylase 2